MNKLTFKRLEKYRTSIFSILKTELDNGGAFSFFEGGVTLHFASYFNRKYSLIVNCRMVTSIPERKYEGDSVNACLDLAFRDLELYEFRTNKIIKQLTPLAFREMNIITENEYRKGTAKKTHAS